jgi:TP901 family phage tail tape measure protein/lambda family phage tail tape measure protein
LQRVAGAYDFARDAAYHWGTRSVAAFDMVRDAMHHFGSGALAIFGRGVFVAGLLASSAAIAALGLATRGVLTTFAEFDKQMAAVNSVIKEGPGQIDKLSGNFGMLREQAKKLGLQTEYTATQVGGGMENLARAGFTAAQVAATIGPALDLATTGAITLEQSTERLGAIMNAYELDARRATDVTDVLAFVNAKTAAGILDMGEAFKYAAGTSHSLGIGVNETAAAIGILADNGIKGTAAGTAIREIENDLLRLATGNHTKKAQAALASLKIDPDKIDPRKVGLIGALQTLEKSGIDAAQALAMFDTRGITPFQQLTGDLDKLDQLFKQSNRAAKYNADQAATMRDNLATDIKRMKSAYDGFIISLGESTGGAFSALIKNITELLTKMSDFVKWLESGTPEAENFALAVKASAAAAAALMAVIAVSAVPWAAFVAGCLTATGAVLGFTLALLKNPLTWIALLIAATAAAFVYFGEKVYTVNGEVVQGWSIMAASAAGAFAWVSAAAKTMAENLQAIWRGLVNGAVATGQALAAFFSGNYTGAVTLGKTAVDSLTGIVPEIKNAGAAGGAAYNQAFNASIKNAPKVKRKKITMDNIMGQFEAMNPFGGGLGVPSGGDMSTDLDSPTDNRDNGDFMPGKGGKAAGKKKGDDGAAAAANKFNNELEQLMKTLVPVIERQRQFGANSRLLEQALASGKITTDQYRMAMGNLDEQSGDLSDAIGKTVHEMDNENAAIEVAIGDRETATRVLKLENDMRKDGLAYLKDGILHMAADTRSRYNNAKARIAQHVAEKALQSSRDQIAKDRSDNDIEAEAQKLGGAAGNAYRIAQAKIADLQRGGVKKPEDLAKDAADAVEQAGRSTYMAARKNLQEMEENYAAEAKAAGLVGYAKERVIEVEKKRLELMRSGMTDQAQINELTERYGQLLDQNREKALAQSQDVGAGLREGVNRWIEQTQNVAGAVSDLVGSSLDSMTDMLTQFVTTGKMGFKDFVRTAIAEVSRLIIKMLILKAIQTAMNFIMPGSGAVAGSAMAVGSGAAVPANFGFPSRHRGGMVGPIGDAMNATRMISPSVFAGARRFHQGGMVGGLKPGERGIIALDTERVLSPEQTRAYNAGMMSAGGMQRGAGGPQQIVLAPVFNNDFSGLARDNGLSEDQAASASKAMEEEMGKYMERWVQQEQRPGGRLAPRR